MSDLLQFLISGLTVGAIYALAAVGYTLVYSASGVINFAQGEFIMLGAMAAVGLIGAGLPPPLALPGAVVLGVVAGLAMEKLAIEPARRTSLVTLIIITLGCGQLIRGLVQVALGKESHALPPFSGATPITVGGAILLPQSLWIAGVTLAIVAALAVFFSRTLEGKAFLATSHNRLAAQLVGIDTRRVLALSFALSAGLGAAGGVIVAPLTFASYDTGTMLGLKGFAAAALGGLGSGAGAVVGGLTLGVLEAMTAGFVSSAYKDALALVVIIAVFLVLPRGLLGARTTERV